MSESHHKTPKFFHVASWTMAVLGAAAFAITVGAVAFNLAQNPISAQTATPSCSNANEQAVISNYPNKLIGGTHTSYSSLNNSTSGEVANLAWRCSTVCISGYDRTKAYNDSSNIQALKQYTSDLQIGNVPAQVYDNSDDFNKAVQDKTMSQELMMRTVILQSLDLPNSKTGIKKDSCEGESNEYKDMASSSGQKITPVIENPTKAIQAAANPQPQVGAPGGPEEQPRIAVNEPKGKKSESGDENTADNTDYNSLLASCIDKVKNMINDENVSSWIKLKSWLNETWQVAKIKSTLPDRKAQYKKCATVLAGLREKYGIAQETDSQMTGIKVKPEEGKLIQVSEGLGLSNPKTAKDGWVCALLKNNNGEIISGKKAFLINGKYSSIQFSTQGGKKIFLAAWTDLGLLREDQFDITEKNLGTNGLIQYSPKLNYANGNLDFKGTKESPDPKYAAEWQSCLKLPYNALDGAQENQDKDAFATSIKRERGGTNSATKSTNIVYKSVQPEEDGVIKTKDNGKIVNPKSKQDGWVCAVALNENKTAVLTVQKKKIVNGKYDSMLFSYNETVDDIGRYHTSWLYGAAWYDNGILQDQYAISSELLSSTQADDGTWLYFFSPILKPGGRGWKGSKEVNFEQMNSFDMVIWNACLNVP